MPASTPKDVNQFTKPALVSRPGITCSNCADWRGYGGRPRCVADRSPFARQPREGGARACSFFLMQGLARPEPKAPPAIDPAKLPAWSPRRQKLVAHKLPREPDAEHAAILQRNAARKV